MNGLLRHKWVRLVGWVVLAVLVLWGLAWAIVPPVLKSQVQRIASEKLGRAVTIGGVEFKPWTLELTVRNLEVAGEPGASAPLLHVDSIYADAELQSVVRLAPVIDALTVQGVRASAAYLGQGKYSFDDVIEKVRQTPSDPDASNEPARFALYNVQLLDASADVDDRVRKQHHELRNLQLAVPFISSFDSKRDVTVQPRLAFTLNGSQFDSSANTLPFAQTRKTDANLSIKQLDLAPYLDYVPASIPVKVLGAVLDADLRIAFEQTPSTSVVVSGKVSARDLKVADARGGPLLALQTLDVPVTELRPLESKVSLGQVTIDAPHLTVSRDAAGQLNLAAKPSKEASAPPAAPSAASSPASASSVTAAASAASAASAPATIPPSSPASASAVALGSAPASSAASIPASAAPSSGALVPASPAPYGGWQVKVDGIALKGGTVDWDDAATGGAPASLTLADLAVDAQGVALPFDKPLTFKLGGSLGGNSRLSAEGTATDKQADVQVTLDKLALSAISPYVQPFLVPTASGQLGASGKVHWAAPAQVVLADGRLQVDDFALASSDPSDARANRSARSAAPGASTGKSGARAPATSANTQSGATAKATTNGSTSASSVNVADFKQLLVSGIALDLDQRRVAIGQVKAEAPHARVSRAAGGQWMFQRWLRQADASSTNEEGEPKDSHAAKAQPWAITVADAQVDNGAVEYRDESVKPAVNLSVAQLDVQASQLDPAGRKPSPLKLSARVGAGRTEFGSVKFSGQFGLDPVSAQGDVEATRLPVHALASYFASSLNVNLVRADSSFKGKVRYASSGAGPSLKVVGDAEVGNLLVQTYPVTPGSEANASGASAKSASGSNGAAALSAEGEADAQSGRRSGSTSAILRASQRDPGDELLSWQSVKARGVDVEMEPGKPLALQVGSTTAVDLYARLILREDARLNLQDIFKTPENSAAAAAAAAAPAGPASAPEVRRSERAGRATAQVQLPRSAASGAAASGAGSQPVMQFGPTELVNAKVLFSDQFVKPNYSTSLSELNGTLGPFNSTDAALADLLLKGKAESTASLEISGKLNPLAKPLALDITGKMRDLELPPLTPYSVKYAGYGIERGKMSVDVHYVVEPSGQLTAENKLVLDQLVFGDKVPGATASLPVKLAVALLADRNGVINVELPLSGSLNDPQFSIGAIIGKAIVNLVVKAITAPFSLLGSIFSGGGGPDQANVIEFKPGTVALDTAARAQLDKVAQALTERPALKLTVVGTSSVEKEREAYRRAQLDELLRAEKRRRTSGGPAPQASRSTSGAASASGEPRAAAPMEITAAERPDLIRAVYREADIPKPRNVLGIARDIEPAQMESLLLANIKVTDEAIRELAVGRGVAVRDYLASRDLPLDRLFLGAVKAAQGVPSTTPPAATANGSTNVTSVGAAETATAVAESASAASAGSGTGKAWVPSAELTLSPR